ncbi:major facilitator superfamily domain-containing protein [Lophiotrema nucula]|uniref:Major facilitator superfamily domain-containing protein n=1 Tax=Lophiotrema nucula TaxID=690887 RepID=A0A6A5Z096_9PLEO|nr:major facilitator superfamily domain-containing protein [Lophiotrema nucula]
MAEDMVAKAEDGTTAAPTVVSSISGARLHFIIGGLWLSLFISAMDTTIITTALIKISSRFNALDQAAWLVTTYLLTYNSFLMILAKFSDVFGVKALLIISNIVFLVFSMACGGAQSMTQLIVFRAFQGIGGSGLYSLTFVTLMKLISPEKMGFYSGVISSVFAIANLLGPLLGGVISDRTSWRWIFWINGPIVVTAIVLLFFSMPGLADGKSSRERLRGIDIVGGILSVSWPVPLLFGLQEGGVRFDWKSGVIIGTLVTGLVVLLLFGLYETWITHKTKLDPIFPIQFLKNPRMALLLLSMGLLGVPFYASFIQLPQRFQGVNHTSAERAGILLLPVTLMTPVGALFTGAVMGKKIAAEYLLIISTAFICLGIGLLSSLSVDSNFPDATYGYMIITGLGLGLASPPYYFLLPVTIAERDVPVGTGALNMLRTLGGAIGVAICSALHHLMLRDKLSAFLTSEQIAAVEDSISTISKLPADVRSELGRVFGRSYNRQFQVMLAFALLNFLVSIALAIARKRAGVFGAMPVRREANEFMKKVEAKSPNTAEEEFRIGNTASVAGRKTASARDLSTEDKVAGERDVLEQAS